MKTRFLLVLLVFTSSALGCGVRGDPLPPLDSPQIGTGNPSYSAPEKKSKKKSRSNGENSEDQDENE